MTSCLDGNEVNALATMSLDLTGELIFIEIFFMSFDKIKINYKTKVGLFDLYQNSCKETKTVVIKKQKNKLVKIQAMHILHYCKSSFVSY